MVLGVFTGVVTARVMEPDGRGLLIALTLWSATIAQFSLVGMDEATVYSSRGSPTVAVRLASRLRTTLMWQSVVGMALTAGVCTVVALKGEGTALAPALSLVLLVPLNMYNQMRLAPLRVGQFLRLWNVLRLLPALTYASLVLGLALTQELTVSTGCIAVVLGSSTTAAACWIVPGRAYATSLAGAEPSPEAAEIPEVRSYGRNLVFANLPSIANQRLDQLLLGIAASPQVLGIYAVAVSIAGVVQMLGTTLEQVLFPRLTAGTVRSEELPRVITIAVVSVTGVGLAISLIARSADLAGLRSGLPCSPACLVRPSAGCCISRGNAGPHCRGEEPGAASRSPNGATRRGLRHPHGINSRRLLAGHPGSGTCLHRGIYDHAERCSSPTALDTSGLNRHDAASTGSSHGQPATPAEAVRHRAHRRHARSGGRVGLRVRH